MSAKIYTPISVSYNKKRAIFSFLLSLLPLSVVFFSIRNMGYHIIEGKTSLRQTIFFSGFGIVLFLIGIFVLWKITITELKRFFYLFPALIINEKGITYEQKFFSWEKVKKITLHTRTIKSSTYHTLEILFNSSEKKQTLQIELNALNMPKEKIEKTARYFFKHDQNSID